ncbi:hypothetical protein Ari01nite_48970 [Paractinoplanes rishiriensis]|uniref:Recombinase zinc beta ribbon domain-containing protein n=1 Tax=Paractinoplanes rishiriensis TaxID=1050105 RepID=A0A919N1P1_9ACTN|nr:hypothetical protein Ari01nite_48970 [Actinoplanes rishiriensis]
MWNRQFTDHREAVPGDRRSSLGPVRIWNPRSEWVVSANRAHPPLVSDDDFTTAQQITAQAMPQDGQQRRYALTGLVICGICGRRMAGHWVNQRPGYRCRHGHTSGQPATGEAPRWLYWAETRLVEHLAAANSSIADTGSVDRLAAHLRSRDLVIVGARGTATITDINEQHGSPPVANNADALEPDELMAEPPSTICPEQRTQGERDRHARRSSARRTRKSRRSRAAARNPTRSHRKRE